MRGSKKVNNLLERHLGIRVQRAGVNLAHYDQSVQKISASKSSVFTGMVEEFNENEITGWISDYPKSFPIKVSLYINDYLVNNTWANVNTDLNTTGNVQSFFIGIKGVWKYCKKNDRLTVRVGDNVMPISGYGVYRSPHEDGESNLEVLVNKLMNGYVFTRGGNLQLSMKLDRNRQKQMISLYKETSRMLSKKCDITPFLIYGSLLGQVREGGFIGHDDDFDIAYVSKHRNGSDAGKELVEIAQVLRDSGMVVELRATAVHVHNKNNPKLRIDLFHLYFNENDELTFSFGVAGTKHFMLNDWSGLVKADFAGHTVMVPENADKLVECMYGASWRTPIVGFNWNHARTRRDNTAKVPVKVREVFNGATS